MSSQSVFHIHNLTVGYRNAKQETVLFENLNVSLKPGELVCFMGPNGIGKSTLIRTLANLTPALSKGNTVRVDPKQISVVLTDKMSALNMTVRELIAYGRYPYLTWNASLTAEDEEIIDQAIQQIHLQDLVNQNIAKLSDGQLQMVMIARALAQDTPMILLDEPTAHLDLNNRVIIMSTLRTLARKTNKAILVSTHELDLALQMADLLWLADDKKLLTGIPEDLVLNGSLDRIFQFKGFDLKTGKVFHEAHRSVKINLVGEGHRFLWTKNALERCGYELSTGGLRVLAMENGKWKMENEEVNSLQHLLSLLDQS